MKVTWTVKDRGLNAIKARAQQNREVYLQVGLVGSKAAQPEPPDFEHSVGAVGIMQEYGDGVPERPFMRRSFDRNVQRYRQQLIAAMRARVIDGDHGALALMGKSVAVDQAQEITISASSWPNTPSTIQQKGSALPLVDTDTMRTSLDHVITATAPTREDP